MDSTDGDAPESGDDVVHEDAAADAESTSTMVSSPTNDGARAGDDGDDGEGGGAGARGRAQARPPATATATAAASGGRASGSTAHLAAGVLVGAVAATAVGGASSKGAADAITAAAIGRSTRRASGTAGHAVVINAAAPVDASSSQAHPVQHRTAGSAFTETAFTVAKLGASKGEEARDLMKRARQVSHGKEWLDTPSNADDAATRPTGLARLNIFQALRSFRVAILLPTVALYCLLLLVVYIACRELFVTTISEPLRMDRSMNIDVGGCDVVLKATDASVGTLKLRTTMFYALNYRIDRCGLPRHSPPALACPRPCPRPGVCAREGVSGVLAMAHASSRAHAPLCLFLARVCAPSL